MDHIEKRIACKLINQAIARQWLISVNDGEEITVSKSKNGKQVQNALATTDEDYLIFHNRQGGKVGWVRLIWGNGEDLISDHTDNEEICALVRTTDRLTGWTQ